LQVLREFLDENGERLIDDPMKRAMLQRDLWAIFDWLVNAHADDRYRPIGAEGQSMLRRPLAQVIARLALDAEAIQKLPNTYVASVASKQFAAQYDPAQHQRSYLPPDLFDPDGPWVCVGRNGSDIVAPAHANGFSRSVFQVFLNLPGGRKASGEYLTALGSFKEPFRLMPLEDGRFVKRTNPGLPQFPAGTQVALVRSPLLIDSQWRLRATNLIESVQLRVVRDLVAERDQVNYEFTLSRALLFAGKAGGLRAVGPDDRDFHASFNAMPMDVFEVDPDATAKDFDRGMHEILRTCFHCHSEGPGVHSFNTFVGGFSPPELLPSFHDSRTTARGEAAAIRLKQTRYDWGLLEGILSNEGESGRPGP
jgi:hypothetical protein